MTCRTGHFSTCVSPVRSKAHIYLTHHLFNHELMDPAVFADLLTPPSSQTQEPLSPAVLCIPQYDTSCHTKEEMVAIAVLAGLARSFSVPNKPASADKNGAGEHEKPVAPRYTTMINVSRDATRAVGRTSAPAAPVVQRPRDTLSQQTSSVMADVIRATRANIRRDTETARTLREYARTAPDRFPLSPKGIVLYHKAMDALDALAVDETHPRLCSVELGVAVAVVHAFADMYACALRAFLYDVPHPTAAHSFACCDGTRVHNGHVHCREASTMLQAVVVAFHRRRQLFLGAHSSDAGRLAVRRETRIQALAICKDMLGPMQKALSRVRPFLELLQKTGLSLGSAHVSAPPMNSVDEGIGMAKRARMDEDINDATTTA